jgi:hypothetical protein
MKIGKHNVTVKFCCQINGFKRQSRQNVALIFRGYVTFSLLFEHKKIKMGLTGLHPRTPVIEAV